MGLHIRDTPGIRYIWSKTKPRVLAWRWGLVAFCLAFWAGVFWLVAG